jgi:hypothetical protein
MKTSNSLLGWRFYAWRGLIRYFLFTFPILEIRLDPMLPGGDYVSQLFAAGLKKCRDRG